MQGWPKPWTRYSMPLHVLPPLAMLLSIPLTTRPLSWQLIANSPKGRTTLEALGTMPP